MLSCVEFRRRMPACA